MNTEKVDSLDQQVNATLQGSWLGIFVDELFQGSGQLALFLLLLEAVSEWTHLFSKPDVYVLLVVALGQSAWLAQRRYQGLTQPWWSKLAGLLFYGIVESMIEGISFFFAPHHLTFAGLMLVYTWGSALMEHRRQPVTAMLGVLLMRASQGMAPILFYIALDVKGAPWGVGFVGFFSSAPHAFLLALAITQVGSQISRDLVDRRQHEVIVDLLQQLKTLSRWGFGRRVVEEVLRDSGTQAASRIERAIGFIDIRGFTAWSEARQPEQVIAMLNHFYAAVLDSCGTHLIKSKMSGDEVLLVLPADARAVSIMQEALRAAIAAVRPLQLSAGAGLWLGLVVEGFFGAAEAQIHDVIGDTVNTAKRLCDHAQGGQLLAGPVGGLAEHAGPEISIQAKGKDKPVNAAIYSVS